MKAAMHILVICNLSVVRFHIANVLKDAGFGVSNTASVTEAIGISQTQTIDAAIIGPAELSADEISMIQELREQNLWFPLLAVSRCERWAHISDLLTNGADEYMQEPFTTATLLSKLEKILRYKAQRHPRELKLNAGFGTIRVHTLGKQVFINDIPANVSTYDYLTLKCIAQNLGEDGLAPQTLLSLQAQRGCGVNLAEATEHLLQRIHP